jgi:hypothetical protein
MVGTFGCCARAASGHATAAPPSVNMNSRRRMWMALRFLPPSATPAVALSAASHPLTAKAGKGCTQRKTCPVLSRLPRENSPFSALGYDRN